MATPWEKHFNPKPDITDFHIFGSIVYVKRERELGKLEPQAQEGWWIGPDPTSNGHWVYWPQRRTATVERNIAFSDQQIQLVEEEDGNLGKLDTSVTESELPIIPVPEEIAEPLPPNVITEKWAKKPSKKIQAILQGASMQAELRDLTASLAQVTAKIKSDPLSVAEAMWCPDAAEWYEAMKEEISRLQERGTYKIVTPPPDANILTSKWVLHTKKDERGRLQWRKGRLVVCGFNQVPDVDYFPDETFASVTKLSAAQAILYIGAEKNMIIHQMDIKSAYLYSKLDDSEKIYMKAPPGIDISVKPGQVLRLKLALYGLKQAGRRWYMRFREIMTQLV